MKCGGSNCFVLLLCSVRPPLFVPTKKKIFQKIWDAKNRIPTEKICCFQTVTGLEPTQIVLEPLEFLA